MIGHLLLFENYWFEAAHIDRVHIDFSRLSSLEHLKSHMNHYVATEVLLRAIEHSVKQGIKICEKGIEQLLL
jgi:hypothetical protein